MQADPSQRSTGNGVSPPPHPGALNRQSSQPRQASYVPTRQGTSVAMPMNSRMNPMQFPMHGGGSTVVVPGPGAPGSSATTSPSSGSGTNNAMIANGNYQNLFVSGLPQYVNDEILHKVFSGYGSIKSAKVMLDTTSGASRGFGFVLFESQQEGCRAYGTLHNQLAKLDDGREFRIHAAPSQHDGKAAALESSVIYVRNVPSTVSEERVQNYFCSLGSVVGCSVRTDSGNAEYRLATVEFKTIAQAREAINKTHNNKDLFPECGDRPVLAKFADSSQIKHERSQKKEQQWQHRWGGSGPPVPPPFGAVTGTAPGPGLASSPAMYGPPGGVNGMPFVMGTTPTSPPPPLPQGGQGTPQHSVLAPSTNSLGSSLVAPQLGGSMPNQGPMLGGSLNNIAPLQQLPQPSGLEATRQQLPDYVPLPLEPRGGFQQILFSGVLGLAPDGRLYPVRVEQCSYVPTVPGGAPVFAPPANNGQVHLGSTPPANTTLAASPSQQQQHTPAATGLGSSFSTPALGGSVHGPVGSAVMQTQQTLIHQDSGPTQQAVEQLLNELHNDVET